MGFFGSVWNSFKKRAGSIKNGLMKTIGKQSKFIGNLSKSIPIIGDFVAPYVEKGAKWIGS